MTRCGEGLAAGADLLLATDEAVAAALAPLAGTPDLVCVFVCSDDPDAVVAAGRRAASATGARVVLGCSAGGVLAAGRGVEASGAVSVLAAELPGVRLRPFHLEVMPAEAGAAVVGLPEHDGDEAAVLLADPHSFPTDGFTARADAALPGLHLVGGLARGAHGAGSTRLLLDGRAVDRGAVGVMVRGAGLTTLVSQGCRPVGPVLTVTAAHGTVLAELAGRPAVERVRQVLADLPPVDRALATAGLWVGVVTDEYADEPDFRVRRLLGTGDGGIVVGAALRVGQTVRLHVRDADAAHADLQRRLGSVRGTVAGALLFSCTARGAGLFGTSYGGADHDPRSVRDGLPAAVAGPAVAGCFTGGELGRVGGRNALHGVTASLLAFPATA